MQLTVSNTYIVEHKRGYSVRIEMPDGSRNYLHFNVPDLDSAIVIREIIEDQSIDHMNLIIRNEDEYYRLVAVLKENNEVVEFHSRKLNIHDVVYERMQLLIAE